ncbi:hypothetical protein [Iodobacter sp.]|uniref:hypothetical protein n=1 Tax=Iodobacter sp. TaxID=1915058 RepID=UPI0025FFBA06|nr:hypothetical protein [Iodobacter sp.]
MNPIQTLFSRLSDRDLPARQANEYISNAQHDSFFYLAAAKAARVSLIKAHFEKNAVKKIWLSANLAGFNCSISGIETGILDKAFFQEDNEQQRAEKKAQLEGCIVIVNNNDVGTDVLRNAYADFFDECTATLFIGWDWDNHHWLDVSTFLAAHSDIYSPAHHENLYLLSRYNWLTAGPVYCSCVQWSRQFLNQNLHGILNAERSAQPLGMHIPYARFSFRIQMISTLSQHYPSIGFSSHTFHGRSASDRLNEWTAHTAHWIAPVLNDVPIRIFDALISGGIPLVPASLRFLPPVNTISREHIVFYSPADIIAPQAVVEQANRLFNEGGRDGILARHQFALQQHHGDQSVRQMLSYAAEMLEIEIG